MRNVQQNDETIQKIKKIKVIININDQCARQMWERASKIATYGA